jgi:tRNA nucleotidyltransferase (CCA-adding enzyme)
MRAMVVQGEVSALVPERVWQELAKGLQEERPGAFFAALADCGALPVCLPECQPLASSGSPGVQGLARAAGLGLALPARTAVLSLSIDSAPELAARLRWPGALLDLAKLCTRHRGLLLREGWTAGDGDLLMTLIEAADALRRPQRIEEALSGAACLLPAEVGRRAMATVLAGLRAARSVDAGAIAASAGGQDIAERVRVARAVAASAVLAARAGDAT